MSAAKQNWPRVKLGEVCEIVAGQSPEGRYYTTDSSFMEFHQGSKNFGAWELEESGVYTREITKVVDPGTLLISVRAPVGDLNVTPRRICIGRGLAGLLPNNSLDRDFLCQFLRAETKAVNDAAGAGSCFSSISRKQLAALEIPLPPLPVQREIVARLERELGAVDKLAKKFEELETAAEAEFKAELKETFERFERFEKFERLGEDEMVGRSVPDRRNRMITKNALRDGCGGEGTRRPTAVRWVKLGEVCVLIGGFAFRSTDYSTTGKYRVVNIGCVQDDWFDEVSSKRIDFIPKAMPEHCRLTQGDLLMSLTGNIGRLCYVTIDDGLLNQRVAKIVPMRSVEKTYLCYLFRSPDFAKALTDLSFGAAQLNISPVKMREISIPLPPLPAQRTIVAWLDAAKAKKEALVAAAKRGREAAALWRKAILKEAFE